MSKDNLGDRMKLYEGMYAPRAMPRLPICARLDGKTFHRLTAKMERPFDSRLHATFSATLYDLMRDTQAVVGYTQSDEITLVYYSDRIESQVFFDGKLQKITSVLASMCTAFFNAALDDHFQPGEVPRPALFDCRVWQVPSLDEAANVLLWREIDCTKNSVQMAARCFYSHRELLNFSCDAMQEMLFQKGVNWNDYPATFKRGTYFRRMTELRLLTEDEWLAIPEPHRPLRSQAVERGTVRLLDMPPARKVTNRTDVFFRGAAPESAAE